MGWGNQDEDGQIGAMADDGMHLVAEHGLLPSILLAGGAWIIGSPGGEQARVDDQFLSPDHPETNELSDQGQEEEQKGQDPQICPALPVLPLRDGPLCEPQRSG